MASASCGRSGGPTTSGRYRDLEVDRATSIAFGRSDPGPAELGVDSGRLLRPAAPQAAARGERIRRPRRQRARRDRSDWARRASRSAPAPSPGELRAAQRPPEAVRGSGAASSGSAHPASARLGLRVGVLVLGTTGFSDDRALSTRRAHRPRGRTSRRAADSGRERPDPPPRPRTRAEPAAVEAYLRSSTATFVTPRSDRPRSSARRRTRPPVARAAARGPPVPRDHGLDVVPGQSGKALVEVRAV